jgi:hypothetical protein
LDDASGILNGAKIIAIFDLTGWETTRRPKQGAARALRMIRRSVGGSATGSCAIKIGARPDAKPGSTFAGRARQSRFERTL